MRKSCICYPLRIVWHEILKLFIGALIVTYVIDAAGFIIVFCYVCLSFIIEHSKVRVWIVAIGSLGPTICNPNVHGTKPVVLSMCEAEVKAGVDTELTTDFFLGGNCVFVVSLFKCGIAW